MTLAMVRLVVRHACVTLAIIVSAFVALAAISPQPALAGAKTKLTVGLLGGSAAHAAAILERFQALNPDIEVEPIVFGWEMFFEKLTLMLASGVAPDVWYGESGRAFGWHEYGFLEDLGPYVRRDL